MSDGDNQNKPNNSIITAILPPYEPSPSWIPKENRTIHPDYNNDINKFLPRRVTITKRHINDVLGFNVRGGAENHNGIYISRVMPESTAEGLGVKEGDEVISVNDVEFSGIKHAEAVRILKSSEEVSMVLRYFPHGYNKTYTKSELHPNSPGGQHPNIK